MQTIANGLALAVLGLITGLLGLAIILLLLDIVRELWGNLRGGPR
jgi:hypothetical protein